MKLLWLIVLACVAWRMTTGRWPWHAWLSGRRRRHRSTFAQAQARVLLGVGEGAGRRDIMEAHRRRLAEVHPDRGGTAELVHQANAARDLLLATLPGEGDRAGPPADGGR